MSFNQSLSIAARACAAILVLAAAITYYEDTLATLFPAGKMVSWRDHAVAYALLFLYPAILLLAFEQYHLARATNSWRYRALPILALALATILFLNWLFTFGSYSPPADPLARLNFERSLTNSAMMLAYTGRYSIVPLSHIISSSLFVLLVLSLWLARWSQPTAVAALPLAPLQPDCARETYLSLHSPPHQAISAPTTRLIARD